MCAWAKNMAAMSDNELGKHRGSRLDDDRGSSESYAASLLLIDANKRRRQSKIEKLIAEMQIASRNFRREMWKSRESRRKGANAKWINFGPIESLSSATYCFQVSCRWHHPIGSCKTHFQSPENCSINSLASSCCPGSHHNGRQSTLFKLLPRIRHRGSLPAVAVNFPCHL